MWQCQPRYRGHEKGGSVSLRRGKDSAGRVLEYRREMSGAEGLEWGDSVGCQGDWGVGVGTLCGSHRRMTRGILFLVP